MQIAQKHKVGNDFGIEQIKMEPKGQIGNEPVKLGKAKSKSTDAPRNFAASFKNLGTRIANFFRSDSKIFHNKLKNATHEELRNGALKGRFGDPKFLVAKGLMKESEAADNSIKASFQKKFLEAVCKDGKICSKRLPMALEDLKILSETTLAKKSSPGTILRENTPDSKYASALFKSVSGSWVKSILTPVLQKLEQAGNVEIERHKITVLTSDDVNTKKELEKDAPVKGKTNKGVREGLVLSLTPEEEKNGMTVEKKQDEVIGECAQKLGPIYKDLLNQLSQSMNQMPQVMRDACAMVYAIIGKAGGTPKMSRDGAYNMIFLRLLNPALTSPILSAPDRKSLPGYSGQVSERAGMLLSKVFQNQANNILSFKEKNSTWTSLDPLLVEGKSVIPDFMTRVFENSTLPEDLQMYGPSNEGGKPGVDFMVGEELLNVRDSGEVQNGNRPQFDNTDLEFEEELKIAKDQNKQGGISDHDDSVAEELQHDLDEWKGRLNEERNEDDFEFLTNHLNREGKGYVENGN